MRVKLCFLLFCFSFSFHQKAQDSISVKFKKKEKFWLIPDYTKAQFAGNIGLASIGIGYKVIHKTLFTELLYGYVPESVSEANPVHLITLKNTFTILNKDLGKGYTFSPITGLTTTLETGNNSFLKVPDVYPDDYYITNAVHFTLFIGALLHKGFFSDQLFKGIDFYIEVGTVDTYLWYALTTKEVNFGDVFSSSIGMNFYF